MISSFWNKNARTGSDMHGIYSKSPPLWCKPTVSMNYSMFWRNWIFPTQMMLISICIWHQVKQTLAHKVYFEWRERLCRPYSGCNNSVGTLFPCFGEGIMLRRLGKLSILRVLITTNFKSSTVLELEFFKFFDHGPLL